MLTDVGRRRSHRAGRARQRHRQVLDLDLAEARVADAAQALAMLAEDPVRRAAMGAAAGADITRRLAPEVVQERVRAALATPLTGQG